MNIHEPESGTSSSPDVATFSGYLENMATKRKRTTEKINEERSGNGVGMSQPKKSKHEERDVRNWSIADVSDFLRSEGYEDEITTKFVGKKIHDRIYAGVQQMKFSMTDL